MSETQNIRFAYFVLVLQTTCGTLSQKELQTDLVELLKLERILQNSLHCLILLDRVLQTADIDFLKLALGEQNILQGNLAKAVWFWFWFISIYSLDFAF